jgi:hypothetical protein
MHMDTHNAFRPSTHPELWGQMPSPVADRREPLPDLDQNAGEWEPAPFEASVAAWCVVLMAAIVAVSALAGWLWTL